VTTAHARARRRTDGALDLVTNFRDLPDNVCEHAAEALLAHLGFEHTELRKASRRLDPDPRYPQLNTLIRAARRDWTRWGSQLVMHVQDLLDAGKLLPITPKSREALEALFRLHTVGFQMRFSGPDTVSRPLLEELVHKGLATPATLRQPGHVDVAFRLGAGAHMLRPHRLPATAKRSTLGATPDPPPLDEVVREALQVSLSKPEKAARDYAKQRAAIYMRRPLGAGYTEAERLLNERELGAIRQATASAVERRESYKQLSADLHDAVVGSPSLSNDMDRVARTELAFAHAFGGYHALKRQAADVGDLDPLVYKFVSPVACDDCQRIWGPPSDPHKYRLSFIEAREAGGGNFRLSRHQWGPVIGPVHPHCTEGPLQYWHEDIVDFINEAADELIDVFGR
jgi:hypothetical protein